MPSKNPLTRAKVNAAYYDRIMLDPVKRAKRRERENAWRKANPELKRGQYARDYERHGAQQNFEDRLWRKLMRIRRAAIKQGLVPYDG